MTESMLNALMRLFAIIASINREAISTLSRNFVESYLSQQFSPRFAKKYLKVFEDNLKQLESPIAKSDSKRTASLSVKLLTICEQINKELHVKNKFLILFSLIQFTKHFEKYSFTDSEFSQTIADTVRTVADGLLIDPDEFNNCWYFITDSFFKIPDKTKILIVSEPGSFKIKSINHLPLKKLHGQIFFLKISQADLYIYYYVGEDKLETRNKYIFPRNIYILPKGSAIRGKKIQPIYYSEILAKFLRKNDTQKIYFQPVDIEFKFSKDAVGIHKFSFLSESGQLVGIMGGSGTGKSTLLKVLNGSYKLSSGKVLLNGYDIHEEKEKVEGIMGYVPQDDLLIGELTVYQNLYYNAKLCFGSMSEEKIEKLISKILTDLDLYQAKDLQVGTPLNRFISGGQRKRLNMAQELIREPYVLFVDEPTSGLSSTDSENVMQLLKEQALHGKLVIAIIHQPSSDLFKLFDKLLILDKGGHPVYYGNPLEALTYLKEIASRVDAKERKCELCGNIHTDDILHVVESKQVNEFGEFTQERQILPKAWYDLFLENIQPKLKVNTKILNIPTNLFSKPGKISQFKTFSIRNFLSKIASTQYLLLAFLIPPILALILGFFTKYSSGTDSNPTEYIFSRNENLPAYIFMSVIVALFIGMIISAEEIIKDKKILERESLLNLSRTSYINSKILFLFSLASIQMLVFVVIGNYILEIKGLTFSYWLILFSVACLAIMLGLNISANLKSVIAIYINIPFVLVPFILLSGVIVKYDKLHYNMTSSEYVPFIGDMMPSRWAYEALMVNQFKNNKYQKYFFEVDKEKGNLRYKLDYLIPELSNKLNDAERLIEEGKPEEAEKVLNIISISMDGLSGDMQPQEPLVFNIDIYSTKEKRNAMNYLEKLKLKLSDEINDLSYDKDEIIERLKENGLNLKEIVQLKQDYHNSTVADLVLKTNDLRKLKQDNEKLIQNAVPIYKEPSSNFGRAQFFSGTKRLGNVEVGTYTFNLIVIWLMIIILYWILISDIFNKTNQLFNKRIPKTV